MSLTILAIESSCDDTSAAILKDGKLLSNVVSSQDMHQLYGGVVPEVASRAHSKHILPVVTSAMAKAQVTKTDLDAIACTRGPGLMGSLMVGFTFAKALAYGLDIPLLGIHHMKAHILAHFLESPRPSFPFLCLTVSGGHTQLVVVRDFQSMEVLGQTIDDAAGEAFDKAGKMMGLPYPAGPLIDKLARKGKAIFPFPEPKVGQFDFSFSGLKTAFLYFLRDEKKRNPSFIENNLADLCASIQHRIVQILVNKLMAASLHTGINQIGIAGGVSANSALRQALRDKATECDWNVYIPDVSFCTDNAAMIAIAGHHKYKAGLFCDQSEKPDPRLPWDNAVVR